MILTMYSVCFLAILASVNAGVEDEERRLSIKMFKSVSSCKNTNKVSQDELMELVKNMEVSDNRRIHCFLGCFSKQMGIMGTDNKIRVDNIENMAAPFKDLLEGMEGNLYTKSETVVKKCASEQSELGDGCAAGKEITECAIRLSKEEGLIP